MLNMLLSTAVTKCPFAARVTPLTSTSSTLMTWTLGSRSVPLRGFSTVDGNEFEA